MHFLLKNKNEKCPNKPFIDFFLYRKHKNSFRGNLVRKLIQNFHKDRLIIQGSNFGLLVRIVVALTQCEGHFAGCVASRRAGIQLH